MKSLKQIQDEIDLIISITEKEKENKVEQKKSVIDRRKKRIAFLKMCMTYLNTNPTDEFLSKEEERLMNRITAIETSYNPKEIDPSLTVKKSRNGFVGLNELEILKVYNKTMGLPELKEQLL